MADSITHHISKGVTQITDTSKHALWFQTNFNMPIHDFITGGTFTRFSGPVTYQGEATSFDLTGFSPGFEIVNGASVFDFDNTGGGSTRSVSATINWSWTDTSGTVLHGISFSQGVSVSIVAGGWFEFWAGANIGCEASEVATSTTYDFRSSATGGAPISQVVTGVSFTNVPSTSTVSSTLGALWVESENLAMINASGWKHSMAGTFVSSTPGSSKAGVMWIDTTNQDIHWVGASGNEYKNAWRVQQFASFYSGSSTGSTSTSTSKKGCIWMDNEFGQTHLAFIGSDGFKYLTGAGVNPY